MAYKKISIALFFFALIAIIAILPPLYSQDFERTTHAIDVMGAQEKEKAERELREVPPKPQIAELEETAAPKEEKEEEKFFIKKINLAGCVSFTPESFSVIVQKYENKKVSLADMDTLAREIEKEYLRRGIIAAVIVVPQEIKEETVTLQVVETRMGKLHIPDMKYYRKDRLAYYWRILPDEVLRFDKISRSIQLMNKNPDREVRVSLHAGTRPGTTDALLSAKTNFPLHFTSSFDNEGDTFTGRSRQSYGIRHNNLLGRDDMLLASYTFGREFSGFYAYHNVPISPFGTSLFYGYNYTRSHPTKEYGPYDLVSRTSNTSISVRQDIFRKDAYLGDVFLGFDAKDKSLHTISGLNTLDRARIFNVGANLTYRHPESTTTVSPQFSQGVTAFGASGKNNPYASRGARPDFSRFTLGLQHKRLLPLGMQVNQRFKGQVASAKLTPQEELYLGGIDSVRGYPASDYLADNGVLDSVELLIPPFFIPADWRIPYAEAPLKEQVSPVVFVDHGWGMRRGALSGDEKRSVTMLSAGAGLRFRLFNQAFLRLEWGFPLGANRPVSQTEHSRFHFSVDFQDRLPQERERIQLLVEEDNVNQWARHLVDAELNQPASPLKQKLCHWLYRAEVIYKQGRLQEAKEIYEKIYLLGESLQRQVVDYVRGCLTQEKWLREKHALALSYEKEGKLEEAKHLWEQISQEAKPGPLVLEF